MPNVSPYNPLDKLHLAESIARALLAGEAQPLAPQDAFDGAGLYAIYYFGGFPAYARIAQANAEGDYGWPIYVGKAVPEGTRTATADGSTTRALCRRLREHQRSIVAADNLEIVHFVCRYLVVDPLWIPLGESLLVGHYRPLWNVKVEGFGIHAPGGGRGAQRRSSWDTLHPGRTYAQGRPPNDRSQDEIIRDTIHYLDQVEVPASLL